MSFLFLYFLVFIISIFILSKSSDAVLVRVKRVARLLGISEIAVTLLGLSILASLPTFLISLFAALRHTSSVSLGTIVGSNIFALLVVLGIAALIKPFHVKMVIEERDGTWLLLSSAILLIFAREGINRWEGIALVALYFPYIYSVYHKERGKKRLVTPLKKRLSKGKEIFALLFITLIMLGSAELVLRSGLKLAAAFHVPDVIMALILIGIGASIPETTIGVLSALNKHTEVTLGDVYGTDIFTGLFILGVCAIVSPIPVSPLIQSFTIPYFILGTIILQLFYATGHKVGRPEGFFLLLLYAYFALAQLGILPMV